MGVWISFTSITRADDATDLSSPFKTFRAARHAVESRDGAKLAKCCTRWCIDSLVADSFAACSSLEAVLQKSDPIQFVAFEKTFRTLLETICEQQVLDKLREDNWAVLRRHGVRTNLIRNDIGVDDLLEYLNEENMRLVDSGADYSVEEGVEIINCIIENIENELSDRLLQASEDYGTGAAWAKMTGIMTPQAPRAKGVLAEFHGGESALFKFYDLVASTKGELEPFVALQGVLGEVTTEGSDRATGEVVVRRAGKIHRWTLEFKREGKDWRIDSLGYGFNFEAVFNGEFPERFRRRWEQEFKEPESKD